MLDVKILAAVFTALTAVAVATGGGTVEKSDVNQVGLEDIENPGSFNLLDRVKNLIQSQPEPENNLQANLTVGDLYEKKIKLNSADLEIQNMTRVQLADKNISSDQDIDLNRFEGSIGFGNGTSVQGNVGEILTSGVNITGRSSVAHQEEISAITVENVEKIDLEYSKVKGSVKTDSADTEIPDSRKMTIKSFSGDLTVTPDNKKLELDGKVHKLESGTFQIG